MVSDQELQCVKSIVDLYFINWSEWSNWEELTSAIQDIGLAYENEGLWDVSEIDTFAQRKKSKSTQTYIYSFFQGGNCINTKPSPNSDIWRDDGSTFLSPKVSDYIMQF